MLLRLSAKSPFRTGRSGATIIESAVVYPVAFLLLLGLIVGGLGVFRFQEVSALARAGTRYASTHGYQYRLDAGLAVGDPGTFTANDANNWFWYTANPSEASGEDDSWTGDIYDQAIRPNLVALDTSRLKVEVAYPPVINLTKPDNWPGSRVTVRVSYTWFPEVYFAGPITLTSTSTLPITN